MKKLILILICLWFDQTSCINNFVLISAPGSGKGTFSQYLIKKYHYVQICPGDIFRKEISLQTDLGKQIKPIVENGEYVDENIVCELIFKNLLKALQQKQPLYLVCIS